MTEQHNALPQTIQDTIAGWLRSGEIDLFIGYERGALPLAATPAFVRDPDDVSRLIWDATCENNLVAFLPRYKGQKVGLIAKGCDSRAINGLIQEGQLERENLRIVGVSCAGVIDPRAVAGHLCVPLDDLDVAALDGDAVTLDGQSVPVEQVLHRVCRACTQRNPIVADVSLNDSLPDEPVDDEYAAVREIEALSEDERWARFSAEVAKCNLCYACRNACPLCYCNVCFVDQTQPRWFNQTSSAEDKQFYQLMRTFHLAGRCVGCGACVRACPQGVQIDLFLGKLRADVVELFDYVAGEDPDKQPPLRTYQQDDPNGMFM